MTYDLNLLRTTTGKIMQPFLWLHVLLVPAVALYIGNEWQAPTGIAFVFALASWATWAGNPQGLASRLMNAVVTVGMVSLLVYVMHGRPWQVDLHMYYFAALAILAAYCDWRVILMATGSVALHHLTLNFALPDALYPGGGDFGRVILHAVIAILEAAVLVWLTYQLEKLFHAAAKSAEAMQAAHQKEASLAQEREEMHVKSTEAKQQTMSKLLLSFEATVQAVVQDFTEIIGRTNISSGELVAATQNVARESNMASSRSTEITSNVQTVASAAEELAASVHEISRRVTESRQVTQAAVEEVRRTNGTVENLATMATKIGEVIQLINGIASQTNLLALNATIEAARAGEAGKGFAVVASEVKALANQTARATDEIQQQIDTIQSETKQAVTAINSVAQTISNINAINADVTTSVEQQSAATSEIARNVQQVAAGFHTISTSIDTVHQLTDTAGSGAGQVMEMAGLLAAMAKRLKDELDAFVKEMQSA